MNTTFKNQSNIDNANNTHISFTKMFGGKLSKSNIFRKIYSIGFEMETGTLIKLTGHQPEENFKDVFNLTLFNSDLNPSFASVLNEVTEEEAIDLSESDKMKRVEPCDVPVIVNKNGVDVIDKNITFQVCNDRTNTLMSRYIQAYAGCKDMGDHANDDDFIPYSNLYEIDAYAINKYNKRIKENGEYSKVASYNVEFAYKEPDEIRECSEFSVVEWVITHYKPAEQRDIIWNALMKSFKLLHNHLDQFTIKYDTDFVVSVNKIDKDDPENIISDQTVLNILASKRDKYGNVITGKSGKPLKSRVKFTLYNAPDPSGKGLSPLHYYRIGQNPSLDEVGGKVQMTFTTNITDLPVVLSTLSDNINLADRKSRGPLYPFIQAAGVLLSKYNKKSNPEERITFSKLGKSDILGQSSQSSQSGKRKTVKSGSDLRRKKSIEFITYMALILYKINAYVTQYMLNKWAHEEKENVKKHYFKDYLTINCRHSNYEIYIALRKMIYENFKEAFGLAGIVSEEDISKEITNIVIKLFVRKEYIFSFIYNELFYPTVSNNVVNQELSGNIFGKYAEAYSATATDVFRVTDPTFQPDETDPHFGDPLYSLASYFMFFEKGRLRHEESTKEALSGKMVEETSQALVGEKMEGDNEDDREYDWFSYARLEGQSTKMPYKNGVVFIEMRGFYRSLCKEANIRLIKSISKGVFGIQPQGDVNTMVSKIKSEIEDVEKYKDDFDKSYKIHLIEELFKRYDYNQLLDNRTLISTTRLLVAEYENGINGILTFIDNEIMKSDALQKGVVLPPAPPISKKNVTKRKRMPSPVVASAASVKSSKRTRRNVNDFSNINVMIPTYTVPLPESSTTSPVNTTDSSPLFVKRTKRSAIVPTNYDLDSLEDYMEE